MSKKDYPRRHLSKDYWVTDSWIQAMFPITPSYCEFASKKMWFDPCPYNEDFNPALDRDGLKIPWCNQTFVNPPYSNVMPWVEKAILENKTHGHTIVMLLKHDSSTKWYAKLHSAGAKFMMIQGRLKFGSDKGCAFPCVLVTLEGFHESTH